VSFRYLSESMLRIVRCGSENGCIPKNSILSVKTKLRLRIQEVQTEYNREIRRCIKKNDLVKVRDVVQSIVQTTLDEPVKGSLEGVSTTVNILVGETAKNRDIVKVLFDLTSKDYPSC
jgi:hypothetical protein